jgi:exopolysaccharide biosynthesis polyprenyl glycosylphosphotransferase
VTLSPTKTKIPDFPLPVVERHERERQRFVREGATAAPIDDRAPIAARPARDTRRVRRRDHVFAAGLMAADLLALALTALVAIPVGADPFPAAVLLGPVVLFLAKSLGLYDRDELLLRKTTLEEAPRLAMLAALVTSVAWLLAPVVENVEIRQKPALALGVVLLVFAVLARALARRLVARFTRPERCLVIGGEAPFARLSRALSGAESTAEVVGWAGMNRVLAEPRGDRSLIDTTALQGLVAAFDVDRLIVSGGDNSGTQTLELLRAAKGLDVRLSFMPSVLAGIGPSLAFDDVFGVPLVGVRRFGLRRSQRAGKRLFDLLVGGFATLMFLPALVAIAVAIRLDSKGPIFFRQVRVGRDGHAFRIFKFRTMVPDAEARKADLRASNEASGGLFKIADDPRVTRVGRLLRRTSLDELPQLFNVLNGEMSLVGPRPLVVDEDRQVQSWDRRRLHLTPGMTGHWQILGSARVPFQEMVQIDYRYVTSWSLWNDVKLLLRTVPYMLARRGM